jgi:hypothetical protein
MTRKIIDIDQLRALPVGSVLRHRNGSLVEITAPGTWFGSPSVRIGNDGFQWNSLNNTYDFPMELLYRPDVDIATKRVDAVRLANAMRDAEQKGDWVVRIEVRNDENLTMCQNYFSQKELDGFPPRLGWAIDKLILDIAKKIEENNGKD